MLTMVTITGADDGVDPGELVALSHEFPFVEWGLLFSAKRIGQPRYPSKEWLDTLLSIAGPGMRLSAHLCGAIARDALAGEHSFVGGLSGAFERVQLNGWNPEDPGPRQLAQRYPAAEFILQARSVTELTWAENCAAKIAAEAPPGRASVLFDPSGGRGAVPERWPTPRSFVRVGFAGGITPDNVTQVLEDVAQRVHRDFWIDMESGVRAAADTFDVERAREVLRRAAPFVARNA